MLEVLDAVPDIDDAAVTAEGRALDVQGRIDIRRLTFAYPGTETPVLHDVSLTIEAGQTAAFVGATGSGKSTLIGLLARLHEPPAGTVFIDGLDVFRSDVAIWRSIMDGSGFRRMTTRDMRVNDIHNPLSSGYLPSREDSDRGIFRGVSSFRDDMPPTTVITGAVREGNLVLVRGSTADASDVRRVTVNGRPARSTRGSFAEWEIALNAPAGKSIEVEATAVLP